MERLTEYFELGAYTDKRNNIIDVSDKLPLFENGVIMGKAIDRLAEFEDFMEEQGFESLEDLKLLIIKSKDAISYSPTRVKTIEVFREMFYDYDQQNIDPPSIRDLNKENQALKDRWQKLKELIKKDITDNQIQYDETYITAFNHYSSAENWVLDRMEELEKE